MARPRNAERIDIRARAVEVAAELFARHGSDGVTLQQIAERVGCRAPALYRYFPSKEALLLAVHDEGFRRLYGYKLSAADEAGASSFERLRLGGLTYVRFALENPHLYELMFNDPRPYRQLQALRADGASDVEDYATRSLVFLRQSILACQRDGYLLGLDPDIAAFTFWSAVHGAVTLAIRQRVPFAAVDPQTIADGAVSTMMALVAATGTRDVGAVDPPDAGATR